METKVFVAQDFRDDLSGKDFSRCKFVSCDFSHAICNESTDFYGAEFHACLFTKMNATKAHFDRCLFNRCDASMATFIETTFNLCDASWTDFRGASFKLANCRMLNTSNCDFHISRIQHALHINPYSRDMLGELIRVRANGDTEILKIAAFVKCAPDLCWKDFMVIAGFQQNKSLAEKIFDILKDFDFFSAENLKKFNSHDCE